MSARQSKITRREICVAVVGAVTSIIAGTSCSQSGGSGVRSDGRLTARPRTDVKTSGTGQIMLGLERKRDAILQLPRNASDKALPLLVMLHGATQSAEDMFWYLGKVPDEAGVAVLAPNSLGSTWESIGRTGFGEDAAYINRALEKVFETTSIDPARVAIAGFSDGASYALSLGLMNGDFFKSLIAFSPGYALDAGVHGRPRIYISHGTHDRILPVDRCGRHVASELKRRGYDVTFHEFDGDHEIPADIAREGLSFV